MLMLTAFWSEKMALFMLTLYNGVGGGDHDIPVLVEEVGLVTWSIAT